MGVAVIEDCGEPGLANVHELEAVRFSHHAAHRIELVDEAVEQNIAIGPTRDRVRAGDRGIDPCVVVFGQCLCKRLRLRSATVQVVVLDVRRDR